MAGEGSEAVGSVLDGIVGFELFANAGSTRAWW